MSKGKTCAQDMVSAEMITQLDETTLSSIAMCFRNRILNDPECPDCKEECFDLHETKLAAKVLGANKINQFRGLGALSVLFRLFSDALGHLARIIEVPMLSPQYAGRKSFSTDEPIFILRMFIEKHYEFNESNLH